MAGSAAAVSKSWHPFPGGVKDIILEYLNVEPLMPPENLRVSKILKRPIMTPLSRSDDHFIPVEEMELARTGRFFNVIGMVKSGSRPYCFIGRTEREGRWMCHVYIVTPCMDDFREAWVAKYGVPWPHVHGDTHPALKTLQRRYDEYMERWVRNNAVSLHSMYTLSR